MTQDVTSPNSLVLGLNYRKEFNHSFSYPNNLFIFNITFNILKNSFFLDIPPLMEFNSKAFLNEAIASAILPILMNSSPWMLDIKIAFDIGDVDNVLEMIL